MTNVPQAVPDEAVLALGGSTVVVKYGGSVISGGDVDRAFARDCAMLYSAGVRLVIVHGGGSAVTSTAARLGIETRFVNGQRYTDQATIEVVTMVLAGTVNTNIVRLLSSVELPAVGISGVDAKLMIAEKLPQADEEVDIGLVGTVTSVNSTLIDTLVNNGYIPVVATVSASEDGTLYNVNADLAAGALAGALKADLLLFMSDVAGIIVDGEVASSLTAEEIESLVASGAITGGMIPKTNAALSALHSGVVEARILDGRESGALGKAIAGNILAGTTINLH